MVACISGMLRRGAGLTRGVGQAGGVWRRPSHRPPSRRRQLALLLLVLLRRPHEEQLEQGGPHRQPRQHRLHHPNQRWVGPQALHLHQPQHHCPKDEADPRQAHAGGVEQPRLQCGAGQGT